MKTLLFILFSLAHVVLTAQKSAADGAPKFAPDDGKKMLILGQDLGSVGGLDNYTNGYVDNISEHIPAGVTSYTSLPSLSGLTSLANWGAGDVRAQSYLEDETFENTFIVIGLYLVNQLPSIINGTHNNSIRQLASWCKGQDRPVYLRIGYEFDGSWNNYNPDQFKNAWKHIVHIFDEEQVKNVAYVWQSAGINTNNIDRWYPGDEYVNWMGYSYFMGWNPGQSIRTFAEERDKPIMIAEATPRRDLKEEPGESHWLVWYSKLFDAIYSNDRIKALAYINANWDAQPMWAGQGWGDSRIEVSEYVEEQWLIEMAKEPWVMASDSLLEQIDFETWLTVATNDQEHVIDDLIIERKESDILIKRKSDASIDRVMLYDTNGKLLYSHNQKAQQHILDISNFKQVQIAVLFIQSNNKTTSKKIYLE